MIDGTMSDAGRWAAGDAGAVAVTMPEPSPGLLSAIDAGGLLVGSAVLAGLLAVMAVGLWLYRRWMLGSDGPSTATGWSLHRLTALRDEGKLSQAEYERLRSIELGRLDRKSNRG